MAFSLLLGVILHAKFIKERKYMPKDLADFDKYQFWQDMDSDSYRIGTVVRLPLSFKGSDIQNAMNNTKTFQVLSIGSDGFIILAWSKPYEINRFIEENREYMLPTTIHKSELEFFLEVQEGERSSVLYDY